MKNNLKETFIIGDIEWKFTLDSFKLTDTNYDMLRRSCEVCDMGKKCPLRDYNGLTAVMMCTLSSEVYLDS